MSIKLDWKVESDGGWNEIGEDPAVLAQRRRRARWLRIWVFLAISLIAAGAAAFSIRLYVIDQQMRSDLRATVAAETLALRIGDKDAFLAIQQDLGDWQDHQTKTYEIYRAAVGRIEITGEVLQIDIKSNRARVILREIVDGRSQRVAWFYELGDEGWKHIPPVPAFWGEQKRAATAYFDFEYYQDDQPLVDSLKSQVDGWQETACQILQCGQSFSGRITIRVDPDPLARLGWANYNENVLLIPSPGLERQPEDGVPDTVITGLAAQLLAERWAATYLRAEDSTSLDIKWLSNELAVYLRTSLDGGGPPAKLLQPLAEEFGVDAMFHFVERVRSGLEAPAALREITGQSPMDVPVSWDTYLEYRLRAEAELYAGGFSAEAALLYSDPDGKTDDPNNEYESVSVYYSFPGSIRVTNSHRVRDTLWVETHFNSRIGRSQELIGYEAFRLYSVDGERWVHTTADQRTWGVATVERGKYITLAYYELDAELGQRMLPRLEEIYAQMADDMGLAPDSLPRPVVVVAPPLDVLSDLIGDIDGDVLILVRSPHRSARPASETEEGYVLRRAAPEMIASSLAAAPINQLADRPLAAALIQRELDMLGIDSSAYESLGRQGDDLLPANEVHMPPESLERLWRHQLGDPYATRDYIAARVLIDMLVERYGPETVPALVRNLGSSDSLDGWLFSSLGIHAASVEQDWRARAAEAIGAAEIPSP